jgi:hypothetical protein
MFYIFKKEDLSLLFPRFMRRIYRIKLTEQTEKPFACYQYNSH